MHVLGVLFFLIVFILGIGLFAAYLDEQEKKKFKEQTELLPDKDVLGVEYTGRYRIRKGNNTFLVLLEYRDKDGELKEKLATDKQINNLKIK